MKKLIMTTTTALFLATTVFAANPIPGAEDGFTHYSTVEGWNVFSDAESEACFIERADESGNVVQVGLTKNQKHSYFGVFTLADVKIKRKEKFEVDINGFVFDGKARGMKSKKLRGDYKGGYFVIKDDNMVNAIMQEGTMTVLPKKKDAFQINLTGIGAALGEARTCTATMSS